MHIRLQVFDSRIARRIFGLFLVGSLVPLFVLAVWLSQRVGGEIERRAEEQIAAAARTYGRITIEKLLAVSAVLPSHGVGARGCTGSRSSRPPRSSGTVLPRHCSADLAASTIGAADRCDQADDRDCAERERVRRDRRARDTPMAWCSGESTTISFGRPKTCSAAAWRFACSGRPRYGRPCNARRRCRPKHWRDCKRRAAARRAVGWPGRPEATSG